MSPLVGTFKLDEELDGVNRVARIVIPSVLKAGRIERATSWFVARRSLETSGPSSVASWLARRDRKSQSPQKIGTVRSRMTLVDPTQPTDRIHLKEPSCWTQSWTHALQVGDRSVSPGQPTN
jgi:hypothetical protein